MSEHEKHDEDELHIVSPRIYVAVGVALLILTGTTVGVSYLDLGVFNAIVALGIAVIKMMLVVLFFMHVKYSSRLDQADGDGRHLHVLDSGGHDARGLLHPRVGTMVVEQRTVSQQSFK